MKNKQANTFVVLLVVVIFVAIVGEGIFLLKQNRVLPALSPSESASTNISASVSVSNPVSNADLTNLDSIMESLNSSDFDASTISDSSLGL